MSTAVETRSLALDVRNLDVTYRVGGRRVEALHEIDLRIRESEIVGVVGESGCGKSTLAAAVLNLLPAGGQVVGGEIVVGGKDLTQLGHEELRQMRGPGAAMIFQDPFTSLNPSFTVGQQLKMVQDAHAQQRPARKAHWKRAEEALSEIGIPDPAAAMKAHPHELSGGQRQRVMIAMAVLLKPHLLIADEPTSALDVTTEAQILELLRWLRDEHGTSIMYVSHDLGSVAQLCDRVAIMYAGRIVESADTGQLFSDPTHPYTRALLATVPSWRHRSERLRTIPGRPPALTERADGCTFADRCEFVRPPCRVAEPALIDLGHVDVRCLRFDPNSDYHRFAAAEVDDD